MDIGQPTRAFTFRMLRWTFGIPQEHSHLECSDGHWAFHRRIQISNAQMDIEHSTGAFIFRMLRGAFDTPPEHSDFKCSDGHWAFYWIQISNAQMDIGHFTGTFRFRMLRWAMGIPSEHSDFKCFRSLGDSLHEMSNPVFWNKYKYILKCRLLIFFFDWATGMCNYYFCKYLMKYCWGESYNHTSGSKRTRLYSW